MQQSGWSLLVPHLCGVDECGIRIVFCSGLPLCELLSTALLGSRVQFLDSRFLDAKQVVESIALFACCLCRNFVPSCLCDDILRIVKGVVRVEAWFHGRPCRVGPGGELLLVSMHLLAHKVEEVAIVVLRRRRERWVGLCRVAAHCGAVHRQGPHVEALGARHTHDRVLVTQQDQNRTERDRARGGREAGEVEEHLAAGNEFVHVGASFELVLDQVVRLQEPCCTRRALISQHLGFHEKVKGFEYRGDDSVALGVGFKKLEQGACH
mmetsp:Transcript_16408/g.46625  ORF Transcript_16408/g.46625 Transcript_16408/m.46625 type:complete len:266 (+) Transcript_16408:146-943(+)